ncbi:MAG TPA: hypothetical protein VFX86_00075 [Candidatus Saccharimonadales bacterium]|nr:hypothetical protein [Candidatus Saccharimonadales bacterium]
MGSTAEAPTFVTLGPSGTDHERATRHFIDFQGLPAETKIEHIRDFAVEGVEKVREDPSSFLVQCSAHPDVDLVTERYPQEVVVLDEFLYATRRLALLARAGVEEPKSLALVPATRGYTDLTKWEGGGKYVIKAPSKPEIRAMLLEGECDAGITFAELAKTHPGEFVTLEDYGAVRTTWIVYGDVSRSDYQGEVIGRKHPEMFAAQP